MSEHEQDDESHTFHLEGSTAIFDKPKSQEEIARQTREREHHEFARDQVKTNNRLAWFTGLLVLGTFAGTAISIWQGTIAQTSANAAQSAVLVASRTLQHTKEQEAAQALVDIDDRHKAQAASDRSALLAQASLQTTIEIARQDQRAWIAIGNVTLALPYNERHLAISIEFTNTGRTPAYVDGIDISIRSSQRPFMTSTELQSTHLPGGVAPPSKLRVISVVEDAPISALDFGLIQQQVMQHEFHVIIRYKDAFGHHHTTETCEALTGDLANLSPPRHFPPCEPNAMN